MAPEYLGLVELGTLRKSGVEIPRATKPWRTDSEPASGTGVGNLHNFDATSGMTAYSIGDTSGTPANRIKWHKIKDGDKTLLIADRMIMNLVSWDDLNGAGFVTGKNIVIDGVTYKCRLLTGGTEKRGDGAGNSYDGGKLPNEWDNYIVNEGAIAGLAVPVASDLDTTLNTIDRDSAHNALWNWFGAYSWCQDTYVHSTAYRATRGYYSARHYDYFTASNRNVCYGWRPVLEILNSAPTISDSDRALGDKASNFDIKYQIADADPTDTLSLVEKVDGVVIRTLSPAQRAFEYTISVDINSMALGAHSVVIEVTDSKGAKATRTYTFNKTNTAPTISGTDTNLGDKNLGFSLTYQVNDADGDSLSVVEKLNGVVLRTHSNPPKLQDITIALDNATIYNLPLLSSNTITIEATDSKGGIAYRTHTFRRVNAAPTISGTNENVGLIGAPLSRDYIVTDAEGDDTIIREKINDVEIRSFQAMLGATNTIAIPESEWIKLPNGTHTLTIEAQDINTAMSIRTFTFEKFEDKIKISLKNPIATDIAATKIMVTPSWIIEGATPKVEACNNAHDDVPAWEDITTQVLENRHYNFINATKTALNWGINIRVTVTKNEGSVAEVVIRGLGGAFE